MLGINTVGIRAIAEAKNDKIELNKTFSSLIILNSITTAIGVVLLVTCTIIIDKLQAYQGYLFIGVFKLLSTYLLTEWFYKGMEDFKYITIRTLLVKCIYVVCVFLFVREVDDVLVYYVLTMLMIAVNAILNIVHTRKFVSITFHQLSFNKYIKPLFIFGFYLIITSMYTTFNITYLGWQANTEEVGYYTTATKLYAIIISIFTAFTGVMLPRMTNLLAEGKSIEFTKYVSKSQGLLIDFSIPVILFTWIFAPQIIGIIAGEGYEGAIIPMRIIVPLIFIIGYEQILVVQTLNPLKKDTVTLCNSILGASVGILLNILLVPKLMSIGSAVAWISSETSVLIIAQYFVSKFTGMKFPLVKFLKMLLYYLPLVAILTIGYIYIANMPLLGVLCMGGIMSLYTILLQIHLKNELVVLLLNKFVRKNG